jgi:signal transduction histidine kinase
VLNDLLDYEQIQISKLNMDISLVSMWSLCESVFWSFRFNLEAKNIHYSLTMELGSEPSMSNSSVSTSRSAENDEYLKRIVVQGDQKKLEQVMRNLISNAIKFTPRGGHLRVEVGFIPDETEVPQDESANSGSGRKVSKRLVLPVRPRAGTIKVCVTDTGEGLTLEQQEQLFTEGVQFNPNRLQDGKGSGLGKLDSQTLSDIDLIFIYAVVHLAQGCGLPEESSRSTREP